MVQKIFTCSPSNALKKIMELRGDGWNVVTTMNTSTPQTSPDAHGVSYGGLELSILCERQYEKPRSLATFSPESGFGGRPCNPPKPGGR